MRALIWIAALFMTGCSAGFWDLDPPTRIPIDPATAAGLRLDRIEVRSSYYDPPDAFSRAFVPAVKAGTESCLGGATPATATIFVHALDLGSDLADGRLSGSVDVSDGRGRVLARFPVEVALATVPGEPDARRRSLGAAFGRTICTEMTGR